MLDYSPIHELNNNRLLSALPDDSRHLLAPYLETVDLLKGQIFDVSPNASDSYAYFPIDSIISLISSMEDEQMELAMVGFDGATGVYNALGFNSLQYKCVVQVSGKAHRIDSAVLRRQFKRNSEFSVLLTHYLHALYAQIAQVAICYRRHRLQQRLQTWMTMMFNRLRTGSLKMKQDEIAVALGYTRQSISAATTALQEEGIISYSRGRIDLLDRDQMKKGVCECYSIMESYYKQIALPAAPESVLIESTPELSLTELAGLYIEQIGATINRVREICTQNDSVFRRQQEILNMRNATSDK